METNPPQDTTRRGLPGRAGERPTLRRRDLGGLLVGLLVGCGGSPNRPEGGVRDAYAGGWPQIFDDRIDPGAVGMSLGDAVPVKDPQFRPRVVEAELVARVRVQTVTREAMGPQVRFLLTLEVARPALVEPPRWAPSSVELLITPAAPAFSIVQSLDTQLRGKTFVGFFRRFDEGRAQPTVHFHLTTDSAEVARVIEQMAAFEALSRQ